MFHMWSVMALSFIRLNDMNDMNDMERNVIFHDLKLVEVCQSIPIAVENHQFISLWVDPAIFIKLKVYRNVCNIL